MLLIYLLIISYFILQNWMVFIIFKVGNFILIKIVMLNNVSLKFYYSNYVYCQVSFKVSFMIWVVKLFFLVLIVFFFFEVDNYFILKVNRLVSVKGFLLKKVVF